MTNESPASRVHTVAVKIASATESELLSRTPNSNRREAQETGSVAP